MINKVNLLKLVADEIKPEIIVSSIQYNDTELLYKLTETTAEKAIQQVCNKNTIPNKNFVGLYEDVINIVKKRIIIT